MLTLRATSTAAPPRQRRLWGSLDVGLAFQERSAHLVAGQMHAGRYTVVAAAQLALAQAFSEQPVAALQATKKWLTEELGYCPGQVVATLPSDAMDYEAIELSATAAESASGAGSSDWAAMAAESLEHLLGSEAGQATYDYWVSQSTAVLPAPPMLHLVWTAEETARLLGQGLAVGGRMLRSLGTPLSALARCSTWTQPEDSVLVVDIEDTTVTLIWCQQGEPCYVRHQIQFTDRSAAASLAARRGVSRQTAESTLVRWGICPDSDLPPLGEVVASCLQDWLERLCYEIQRTVRYLVVQQGRALSPRIALCGSSATILGLAPWLSNALGLSVVAVTPPSAVRWKSAQPYDPSYAMALANALEARWQ